MAKTKQRERIGSRAAASPGSNRKTLKQSYAMADTLEDTITNRQLTNLMFLEFRVEPEFYSSTRPHPLPGLAQAFNLPEEKINEYLDLPEHMRLADTLRYYLFLHYLMRVCYLNTTLEEVSRWYQTRHDELGMTPFEAFVASPRRLEAFISELEWATETNNS
ncbi:MAG: hypothetical protein ACRCYY_10780 [Trueperaceae bacterium]